MRRFFDRSDTHWRSNTNCLHVYAVPADESTLRPAFTAMSAPLAALAGLGHQPVEHLHMTVQRLDLFEAEVARTALITLTEKLAKVAGSLEPFLLDFAAPVVTSHAIQAIAVSTMDWRRLTDAVRSAVTDVGLASALTEPPPAPHYTLAYATADQNDATISTVLDRIGRPSSALVETISLVSVDQDPDEGSFRFSTLRTFALGR